MGSKFPHRDYGSVDVFRRKDIFMLAQKPAAICNNLVGNSPLLGVLGICLFYSLISFTQDEVNIYVHTIELIDIEHHSTTVKKRL